MPLSKDLVEQKLKGIIADIEHIKQMLEAESYESLVTNESLMTETERRLERIINRAIDINIHLMRSQHMAPPDDYTKSFLALAELNILSAGLSTQLAPAVGTRNILVHEYDDLDTMLFYDALQKSVNQFPEYCKSIEEFLEQSK